MARGVLQRAVLIAGLAALLSGGLLLWREFHEVPEPPFAEPQALAGATLLADPLPLPSFRLLDQRGRPFTEQELLGRWTFLFFGYTSCPDICPLTLRTLARAAALLRQQAPAASLQVVFVSVDPGRDTPEKLAQYLSYFFETGAVAATGTEEQLLPLTRSLGIAYRRHAEQGQGDYLVDHTASILLLDPQGRLRALMSPPHEASAIAEAFRRIASG